MFLKIFIMSKLSIIAAALVHENSAAALAGFDSLESIKGFYKNSGLDLPVSLTFTQTVSAARLTKDEKNALQAEYISLLTAKLQGTEIPENAAEIENNYSEMQREDGKVTFTKTYPYSVALENKPAKAVAAKLVDMLSAADNEKYNSIRRKETAALIDIDSIPAFIKELEKIHAAALAERAAAAEAK